MVSELRPLIVAAAAIAVVPAPAETLAVCCPYAVVAPYWNE